MALVEDKQQLYKKDNLLILNSMVSDAKSRQIIGTSVNLKTVLPMAKVN